MERNPKRNRIWSRAEAGPPLLLLRNDPSCVWGCLHLLIHPPFTSKFWNAFPHLPTFPNQALHSHLSFPIKDDVFALLAVFQELQCPAGSTGEMQGHHGLRRDIHLSLLPAAPTAAAPNPAAHFSVFATLQTPWAQIYSQSSPSCCSVTSSELFTCSGSQLHPTAVTWVWEVHGNIRYFKNIVQTCCCREIWVFFHGSRLKIH